MNEFEELANRIIDEIEEVVIKQHPEINLNTEVAKESDIEEPAVICGVDYYNLEDWIANKIKEFIKKKTKKVKNYSQK